MTCGHSYTIYDGDNSVENTKQESKLYIVRKVIHIVNKTITCITGFVHSGNTAAI